MTFPSDTLPFLRELAVNNNRPWFVANKVRFDAIHKVFIEFCAAVVEGLAKDDPSVANVDARQCVYRIYRDLRFSPDKRPYKDHIAFWVPCGGNKHVDVPGYYLQIAPEGNEMGNGSCLGGGVYAMRADTTDLMRQEVYYQMEELQAILHAPSYRQYYGADFWDPQPAKTVTANFRKMVGGIPEDYPYSDLLKHRSYVSLHCFSNDLVPSNMLLSHCLEAFRATIPLNNFFRAALM